MYRVAVLVFPYNSENETVDVKYVRVRKPDGALVVTSAHNIQDVVGDLTSVAPMYSDVHEKHVPVKALGVGGRSRIPGVLSHCKAAGPRAILVRVYVLQEHHLQR